MVLLVCKMPMPYYFRHLKYFRMADNNKGEDVPCVYVYEEEKSIKSSSIYQNDDISLEVIGRSAPPTMNKSTRQAQTKKSEKRRSRYDENHYALPDNDDNDQSEYPESVSEIEPDSKTKSMVPSFWRTACGLLLGLMLLSVTANIVQMFNNNTKSDILHSRYAKIQKSAIWERCTVCFKD